MKMAVLVIYFALLYRILTLDYITNKYVTMQSNSLQISFDLHQQNVRWGDLCCSRIDLYVCTLGPHNRLERFSYTLFGMFSLGLVKV